MTTKRDARAIIKALEDGNVMAECPCCGEPVRLRDAGLFFLDDFTKDAAALYQELRSEQKERRKQLRERRKSIPADSEVRTTAVNIGNILERLCPALPGFRFQKNDCRSLFDPIDYLIFEGLTDKGRVSRIIFSEIKTGGSRLSARQRQIRDLVDDGEVAFDTYELEKK
jgi:predicted Holliday junction resolvase-like endonuclease